MNTTPKATMKLLIIATPAIALLSSVSPGLAGTLAKAEAQTLIYNFSQLPTKISTFTDTQTLALAQKGAVLASANANAYFDVNCLEPDYCFPLANNSSQAITLGGGKEYLGLAQSQAAAIGYQFKIADNQEFSFDFLSFLNLETQKSQPQESTRAENSIAFYLFEDSTNTLLDFFSINSSLNSSNKHNLSIQNSNGFQLSPLMTTTNHEENQASAEIFLSGLYSRQFSQGQSLTLITYQKSATIAQAPEPSTPVWLLIMGALGVALGLKKKSSLSD